MSSSAYDTYDKIISLDWNGQYFVLTARNEITSASFIYAYSSDGQNWSKTSFPANISSQNPYMVKWLGDKYVVMGNLNSTYVSGTGSSVTQSCIVNIIDGQYPVATNTNLSSDTVVYDVERNIEQSHRIVFPRTTALALGDNIAFSCDKGNSWTTSANASSLFSGGIFDAVWNGTVWAAGGSGTHTIATSLDGNIWLGRGSYAFSSSCNGIDWSPQQNKFVAVGSGTNIVATSCDGVYWKGTNAALFSAGNDIKWNGSVWVAVGVPASGGKSIAYSSDGITWNYPAQSDLFGTSGIRVYWDGAIWTAFGSDATNNLATSSDGISWVMSYSATANSLTMNLTTGLFADASLNIYPAMPYPLYSANSISATKYVHNNSDRGSVTMQPISIACGEGGAVMAYSPDGIQWTAINTDIFTRCNQAVWNGSVWVAVGYGTIYWSAISCDGISWQGSNSALMTESFDVAWNGQYFVAVGQGSTRIARSADGRTWSAISESIFSTNITSIDWTGKVWLAYGSGTNTTAISTSIDASSWTAQNLCEISCTNILLANSPSASASSYSGSNIPGNAIDGNFSATMTQWTSLENNYDSGTYVGPESTTYNSSSVVSGEWLQIALSSSVICKNYYIVFALSNVGAIPQSWVLLGSNDGSAWNLLDTFAFSIQPSATSSYPFACLPLSISSNTNAYAYYRVVFTSNFGDSSVSVSELVLFDAGTHVLDRYIRPVILKDCVLHPTRILSDNGSTPNIYRITDLSCNIIRDNALHNQYANNIMYGLSGEFSACAFDGELHVVGSRTGEVAYISNSASVGNLAFDVSINGVGIQSGVGGINAACYNRKYILLGGSSGAVTYGVLNSAGTPTFYPTNASSLFSTIYGLASNPGYGPIVSPNRIYIQESDRLRVVTPKYYDAALSSDTSISFNVYKSNQ